MVLTDVTKKSNEEKILNRLYRLDIKLRGKFLFHVTGLETIIDDVIATHFLSDDEDKHSFFTSLILHEIDLHAKIRVLLEILKKYPELQLELKSLEKKLEKIKKLRNRFAHSYWYSHNDFLKKNPIDKIRLEIHKKGKKEFIEITKKELEDEIFFVVELIEKLDEVKDHIENSAKRKSKKS